MFMRGGMDRTRVLKICLKLLAYLTNLSVFRMRRMLIIKTAGPFYRAGA
jgi:hypothetical protein